MLSSHPLDRREFLKAAAAAAAACSVGACARGAGGDSGFLTLPERRTLEVLCGRIIPEDDFPGAVESGVVDFIDRQLATRYSDYQALYRLGLQGLEQTAVRGFGKPLSQLSIEEQIEVLRSMEQGQAPASAWPQTDAGTFFRLVVAHTMYGYYGDPRHGGNRDGASWRMIGLPYPPVRGRDPYQLEGAASGAAGGEA
jgi:gluconate 2-dehydrogenase gamma chain